MNLPATVHLDSQVDFLPAVAGLTVRLIIVINRGKELIDMIYYLQQFHLFVVNHGC